MMASDAAGHAHESPPSPWVVRWSDLVSTGSEVLDVACGGGRHTVWFAARGCRVTALDRDPASADALALEPGVTFLQADIESAPWPLAGRVFAAVIVTNYLHRPLLPTLVESVAPGGVLIYETFALGNERFGRPSNPAFLLKPEELLDAVRGTLRVVAYEDIELAPPRPAMVQRICARRE